MQPLRHPQEGAWAGHCKFARWLVERMRPTRIVELGVYQGCSYLSFCEAVAYLELPTRCFAVDSWKGDDHALYYGEHVYEQFAKDHEPYRAFSEALRMTFDEAAQTLGGSHPIDILHIDGCHTYEAVMHDLDTWLPFMSGAGVVLLHDTSADLPGFGVRKAFAEKGGQYRASFEFVHSYGLGVIEIGQTSVFGDQRSRVDELRDFFSH